MPANLPTLKDDPPISNQPKDDQSKNSQKDGQPEDGQPKNNQPKDSQIKDGVAPKKGFITTRVITNGLLTIFLLTLTIIGNWYFPQCATTISSKWSTGLNYDNLQSTSADELKFPSSISVTPEEQARLKTQLIKIRMKANQHLTIMKDFYANYFSSILMFSIAGAISAICLVLISKKGWDVVDEHVITTFLVMSAVTAYYGSMPSSFQQQQNITDNKVLYLKFVSLENEVLSYPVTGDYMKTVPPKEGSTKPFPTVSVREFINYIDQQLAQDNIAIGFDSSKAPNYSGSFNVK